MHQRTEDYRHCPHCSRPLTAREVDGRSRAACPGCGFVHFRDPKVSAVALLIHPHDDSVLLTQRRYGHRKGRWALPGGFVEADEMPETALKRELMEETGLTVVVGDLVGLFPLHDSQGDQLGFVMAYRCQLPPPSVARPTAGDDASQVQWLRREDDLPPLAFDSTRRLLERWRNDG